MKMIIKFIQELDFSLLTLYHHYWNSEIGLGIVTFNYDFANGSSRSLLYIGKRDDMLFLQVCFFNILPN